MPAAHLSKFGDYLIPVDRDGPIAAVSGDLGLAQSRP